jgi:hypothetical protein
LSRIRGDLKLIAQHPIDKLKVAMYPMQHISDE